MLQLKTNESSTTQSAETLSDLLKQAIDNSSHLLNFTIDTDQLFIFGKF